MAGVTGFAFTKQPLVILLTIKNYRTVYLAASARELPNVNGGLKTRASVSRFDTRHEPLESILSTGAELKVYGRARRHRAASWLHERAGRRHAAALHRALFSALAVTIDAAAIALSSIVVGIAYHSVYYGVGGMFDMFAAIGLSVRRPVRHLQRVEPGIRDRELSQLRHQRTARDPGLECDILYDACRLLL